MMNCLFYMSSAAVFSRNRPFIVKTSLYGYCYSSWKRSIHHTRIKAVTIDFMFMRFPVQCYTTRALVLGPRSPKLDPGSSMEEKDAFYIVRKGDTVGVYKSLSDCQAQVGSSVCDPSVSVFKANSLPGETEEYLVSRGLKNATYSICAADVKEDLFGELMPCPFQQPSSSKSKASKNNPPVKRSQEVLESDGNVVIDGSDPERKYVKLETSVAGETIYSKCDSCILEFDGASKGNPGQAGAGAVLRAEDGSAVKGLWKTKNQNLSDLCKEVKELKDKFGSFQISHFVKGFNSDADAQAKLAINLQDGKVHEDCIKK